MLLFLATNLAIVLVLSVSLSLLGFEGYLDRQGINLNLESTLLFAALQRSG